MGGSKGGAVGPDLPSNPTKLSVSLGIQVRTHWKITKLAFSVGPIVTHFVHRVKAFFVQLVQNPANIS